MLLPSSLCCAKLQVLAEMFVAVSAISWTCFFTEPEWWFVSHLKVAQWGMNVTVLKSCRLILITCNFSASTENFMHKFFCCLAFIDTQLLCLQIKLLLTCTMLQDTLISESLQQFTATSGREETLLFEELFHLLRTSSIMVVTALSSSHLCICCASWQACAFSRSAYILDSHHCTYLLVCLIRLKNIFTELHLVHLMILLTPSPLPPIELCLSKASLNGQ